jgi:hypothetical protein
MALTKLNFTGQGVLPTTSMPTDSVLQVKKFQLTTSQIETIATADTDQVITNFNISITPKSTSSIIKLEANLMYESANNATNIMFFFYRNTTKLANTESSPGVRRIGIMSGLISYYVANDDSTPEFTTLTYFDEPQTTSAITYKLGINSVGTSSLFINRSVTDTNNNNHERGVSFISAMEIAG